MSLTDTRVKAAKPRLSDYTLADGNGLYLRVRRNGAKTWITRRMIGGKVHVQTIGTYPDTALVDARLIAAGKAVNNEAPDKRTVRALGERYAQRVLERRYKDSRPMVRYLERDLYPLIGSKRVGDVVPADVDRALQEKLETAGPVAANMLLTVMKGMFAFGVRTGWATSNPAATFTRSEAGGKQAPRQRVLTDAELRAMWWTPTKHVAPLRLAMLTGCRISEACAVEWSQIDIRRKRWTQPASATKQGREHWVHLSAPALELLEAQPRTGERVFPGANRMVMARTLMDTRKRSNGGEDPGFTIHDARRSVSTRLAEAHVNPLVVELMLGHSLPKVLATYNVAAYEKERIAATELWGKKLAQIVAPKRKGSR